MFNFPSNPTEGQQVTGPDGAVYTFTDGAWTCKGQGGGGGGGGGGTAAETTFAPTGNVSATNVQAAIAEVDAEKVAKTGDTMSGALTASYLTATGNGVKVTTPKTLAYSNDPGSVGHVCWDNDYLYVCVAANTWKRSALSTFAQDTTGGGGTDPEEPPTVTTGAINVFNARANEVLYEYQHAFSRGVMQPADTFVVKTAGGATVTSQFNPIQLWPDGSVMYGAVAAVLPVAGTQALTVSVTPALADALDEPPVINTLATGNVTVKVKPPSGTPEVTYTMGPTDGTLWRNGALYQERRMVVDVVPTVNCGSGCMRLIVDRGACSDGTEQVTICMANDIALDNSIAICDYDITVTHGNATTNTWQVRSQGLFQRFVRTTRNTVATQALVRPDADRLADLRMCPRYDWQIGVAASYMTTIQGHMAGATWNNPLDYRQNWTDMGAGGAAPSIGHNPQWIAAWIVGGDATLTKYAMDKAEAYQACNWHHWDRAKNTILNAKDHLDLLAAYDDPNWRPTHQTGAPNQDWRPEPGHAPEPFGMLWLHTGRRHLLDGLISQASWAMMASSPGYTREWSQSAPTVEAYGLFRAAQMRQGAWGLRSVLHAKLLVPPSQQPYGDLFTRYLTWNANRLHEQLAAWTTEQGAVHGWGHPIYANNDPQVIGPWQTDMTIAVLAHAAALGFDSKWTDILNWWCNFGAERFLNHPTFPAWYGSTYNLPVKDAGLVCYTTWAQIKAAEDADSSHNTGWSSNSGNDYWQRTLMALAMVKEITGHARMSAAWDFLIAQPIPYIDAAYYQVDQSLNVVPKGYTRS